MAMQNDIINEELHNEDGVNGKGSTIKKAFVEPAISVPVDVLEATTFFQAATSGATNYTTEIPVACKLFRSLTGRRPMRFMRSPVGCYFSRVSISDWAT